MRRYLPILVRNRQLEASIELNPDETGAALPPRVVCLWSDVEPLIAERDRLRSDLVAALGLGDGVTEDEQVIREAHRLAAERDLLLELEDLVRNPGKRGNPAYPPLNRLDAFRKGAG